MRKPGLSFVKQVYGLENYCHHVIQVVVMGSLENSQGLFGKHEKGDGRSVWIEIRKRIGIGVRGIAVFEGHQTIPD